MVSPRRWLPGMMMEWRRKPWRLVDGVTKEMVAGDDDGVGEKALKVN